MRSLITVVLCFLLACGECFAAPVDSPDPALLKNVMTMLGSHTSVRAAFAQTRTNPTLAQPQTSHGKLLFVLGHGMLWQTEQPYQETLALTGSRSARLDAQGRLQPAHDMRGLSQISQMLQSLLAGKPDEALRQFDIQASGTTAHWTLLFTPKQARVARVLASIELTGDAFLEGIRIGMHDGSATSIRFTDTRDAGPLAALEKEALGVP